MSSSLMPVTMKGLVQSGLTFKMFLLLQGLYHVTCSTSAMYIMHFVTESDTCKAGLAETMSEWIIVSCWVDCLKYNISESDISFQYI